MGKAKIQKLLDLAVNKIDSIKFESIAKWGWDQDNEKVKIYITSGLDGVGTLPKNQISCDFEDKSLDFKV